MAPRFSGQPYLLPEDGVGMLESPGREDSVDAQQLSAGAAPSGS